MKRTRNLDALYQADISSHSSLDSLEESKDTVNTSVNIIRDDQSDSFIGSDLFRDSRSTLYPSFLTNSIEKEVERMPEDGILNYSADEVIVEDLEGEDEA